MVYMEMQGVRKLLVKNATYPSIEEDASKVGVAMATGDIESKGSAEFVELFIDEVAPLVRRDFPSMQESDFDDQVQKVRLKVWRKLEANQLPPMSQVELKSYLRKTIRNQFIDCLRESSSREFLIGEIDTCQRVESNEDVALVDELLDKLSRRELQLIRYTFYEDRSLKDVAKILKVTPQYAGRLVRSVLQKLHREWKRVCESTVRSSEGRFGRP